ncbi:hypothetical protein ACB098_05G212600 [Castanea mollissima]
MRTRLLCSIHFLAILLLFYVNSTLTVLSSNTGSSSYFGGNETDYQALLAFKTKITQDPRNVLSSWNDSLHFCQWEGVTCGRKHRRVTVLNLTSRGLVGSLSPHIGNLSFMRVIDLSNNAIGGKIHNEVGRLFRLQVLNLAKNSFQGEIPANLSHCSNLKYFEVGNNNLSGSIPMKFASLSKLVGIYAYQNYLTGGIPPFIGNLSSLHYLSLTYNVLEGQIPNALGQLRSIEFLALGENKLLGLIPSSLYNLSSMTVLSLAANELSGSLPTNLFLTLPHLQRLQIFGNQFNGSLPASLSNASKLQKFDAGENNFTGKVSINFGGLQLLDLISIYDNNLGSGDADELDFFKSLVNCSRLRELNLGENQFKGSLSSCTSLEYLYMEGNFFRGVIPTSLSTSRGIQVMDLSRNKLSGQIPNFLDKLSLKNLNLSFNDFEGEVPTKGVFANASALSIVGNDRLCGGISKLKLPRCVTKENKKMKWHLAIKILISVACVILVVTTVSFFLFYWHKNRRKENTSGSYLRKSLLKVSYQMLLKATNGFSSANLIGVGSFGSVYKGILGEDGSIVAVKVLNLQRRGASRSFISECETLKNIRHRNLVKIITSCSSVDFHGDDFKALVYEFMPNGNLENWLHDLETDFGQVKMQNLNLLQRINIAIDVACALDYLHHHCPMPVVHCDLKPSNILFDCDMIAHVGDFGLAKFLLEQTNLKQSSSIGIRGTIGYTPPEYGLGSEVSTKGDVYSYGILLLELITGKRPTDSMFDGGLNLHNYASIAWPNRVLEITDPKLLNNNDEVIGNHNCTPTNRTNECLISMVKLGLACSMELPQERWDISKAISELQLARDLLLGARI